MNEQQKIILNYLQSRFPIEPRPFAAIAEQLGSNKVVGWACGPRGLLIYFLSSSPVSSRALLTAFRAVFRQ